MKKFLKFLDDNILRFLVVFGLFFIPLYPKLPSIGISHVWVYIRLEDFIILLISLVWLIQLVRKKVSLPRPEGYALAGYWIVGLITLVYCLLFVASHLANFFPQIAFLEWLRRIEYMILFFAAFASVKKANDIVVYIAALCVSVFLIVIYGFGQKFYPMLWYYFPAFFKAHPFCFPAFLTGNEEFAKGTPFCLDTLSRISSTFGGHYDLAAFLVVIIPILVALFIAVRRVKYKAAIAILTFLALELLNFTSSRTSFGAYVLGVAGMLIIWKKKWWIIPVLAVSIGSLFIISTTTLQRYAKTIQQVQVVQVKTVSDRQLQKMIEKAQQQQANSQPQSPPPGTLTVGSEATSPLAIANPDETSQVVTAAELASLQNKISTVSGAFLLSKAYALDVSLTTRFQAEWPRDWNAFVGSPLFGTGYSSLTLASDNDYLRALGETGLFGTLSFLLIFIVFGIYMRKIIGSVKDPLIVGLLYGLVGGLIGLLINAFLIDVFEASKVAEPLWILLGIGVGALKLYQKEKINYKKELLSFFGSRAMISIYLLIVVAGAFMTSINNFFVADDFSWLRWAANADTKELLNYFVNAQGFFYRPFDKVVVYFLYQIFSFQPQGFHIFTLVVHFVTAIGVFFLAKKISGNRLIGALTAVLFVLHPAHNENIYWFSTLSMDLSALFIIYMLLAYIRFRENKSVIAYLVSIVFAVLTFFTYEIFVVVPFVLLTFDLLFLKTKKSKNFYATYLPFVVLFVGYFIMRAMTHTFSGGGDYSYHLSRIIPNIVGNFFGYTGLFLAGLPFIAFYNFLREALRTEWIYFTVVAVIILGYVGWMISVYRVKIKKALKVKEIQLIVFCFIFAFVTLLPFLPLGNIAPRYMYLGSVGYTLALVVLLHLLFSKWVKKASYVAVTLIVVVAILSGIYFVSDRIQQTHWQKSGEIANNTLLYFRRTYANFSPKTDLYFANTPLMQNNAWIFPVGLADGLWFIYRDKMPQVYQVGSVDDAKAQAKARHNKDYYIFTFDQNNTIKQVK